METFEPAASMPVDDPKQIRAFSDPLRVRVLVVLTEREATNQQLADSLGEPQAKVLYHLRVLVEAELIRLVRTRVKGGNVEKYYRAVARTFELRPSPELRAEIVGAEAGALTRDLAVSGERYPDGQRLLARSRRLRPDQIEAFFERLTALADEFWPVDAEEDADDDSHGYVLAAFVYRNPRDDTEDGPV
jgi:DNA-binding transcriptional ArsR family regulator